MTNCGSTASALSARAAGGWCILRTDGRRTLTLARSLNRAGIEAWTPTRTTKREKPGRCSLIDGKRPTIEVDSPILPTFVFARRDHLHDLVAMAAVPNPHPSYAVFRHNYRYPIVFASEIVGLQEEEREAQRLLERMREAEGREERRRIEVAAARNERARRKMLRAERHYFKVGALVTINEMAPLAGMVGVVETCDGRSAVVVFGGALKMRIEAWQVVEHPIPVAA